MAHKEYGVTDIFDILRRAQAGDSIRRIAKATGVDRKTISNYLRIAAEHGFERGSADDHLTETASTVFRAVHGPQMKSPSLAAVAVAVAPLRTLSRLSRADRSRSSPWRTFSSTGYRVPTTA